MKVKLFYLVIFIFLAACAPTRKYVWTTSDFKPNKFFQASLSPAQCIGSICKAFELTIENKTDYDLEIDWNKSLYIFEGQTFGAFMFEGIIFRDRNDRKAPDIVFKYGTFKKIIYPNNLVNYDKNWHHKDLKTGQHGVYLVIRVGEDMIREKILIWYNQVFIHSLSKNQNWRMPDAPDIKIS